MSKQALDGARMNAFGMDPNALTIVGHDTNDGTEHPLWDERAINLASTTSEEFIKSIMAYGVRQPVEVRKNGDRVEVVLGRHRVYGCREANRRLLAEDPSAIPHAVPTMAPRRMSDDTAAGIMNVENEARIDDSAIVRARKMQRMLDRNIGLERVAIAFCRQPGEIERHLNLLDLDDRVQKAIDEGRLAMTTALTLRDLTRDEQWSKAQEFIASGVTVQEAKRQTKVRKSGDGGEDDTRGKRPGMPVLRRLADNAEFLEGLDQQTRDFLAFVMGDWARVSRIKGLTAALKDGAIEKKKEAEA